MKRIFLILLLVSVSKLALAQWNGRSTSESIWRSGNVGIGASNPASKLTIMGSGNEPYLRINSRDSYQRDWNDDIYINNENKNIAGIAFGTSAGDGNTGTHHRGGIYTTNVDNSAKGNLTIWTRPYSGRLNNVATFSHDAKVGIGTNNPTSKLTIVGSGDEPYLRINSRDSYQRDWNDDIYVNNENKNFAGIAFGTSAGDGNTGTHHRGGIYTTNVDNSEKGNLTIWTRPSGGIINEVMTLTHDGKTGIGTNSPSSKLTIQGSGNEPYLRINSRDSYQRDWNDDIYVNNENKNFAGIAFGTSAGDGNTGTHHRGGIYTTNVDNSEKGNLTIWTRPSGGIINEVMTLTHDGKVGIGTTDFSGNHKLRVEGSIGAREIKCEANGWSDFVFEKNYELLSLEEVENHINQNGHLPEIPSEAEVTKNGINVAQMDAKLLQKIEELTLYLIEVNKQNKAQQKEIEQLKNRMSK